MEVTRGRQFVEFAYLLVRKPSCEIAHKDNFWFSLIFVAIHIVKRRKMTDGGCQTHQESQSPQNPDLWGKQEGQLETVVQCQAYIRRRQFAPGNSVVETNVKQFDVRPTLAQSLLFSYR